MVQRTGDWARARRLLSAAPMHLQRAVGKAVRQEAQGLRNAIVRGLTSQSPGGEPLRPPSQLTIAARQMKGFGGSKALLVRGDLRNSVGVVVKGDEAFIGVLRSARSGGGESLANLAELHEFGGPPVVIPITPKMRRFLFALIRKAGQETTGGDGRGVVVTQVPARPFLRPAFNKLRQGADRRFLERVAKELGLAGGGL